MKIYSCRKSAARTLALAVFGVFFASCAPKTEPPILLPIGDGHLAVPGGSIWYKVSGSGKGTPVVLLHGGPGFSSFYLKPLEDIGNDRQVVRYDQLGGGKSEKITDTTMFTIQHFVRELDSLRVFLGVEKWHVLGHSWGTIVAVEYYKVHPERVATLTLASASLDIPAWEKNARQLVATLSDSSQRAISKAERVKKYDDPSYQNAMNEFYGKYVWRHPVEADLDSLMATANQVIYNYMQGPSEFIITGTLGHYDATAFLKQIRVPVLYTVGEFDEANPDIVRRFAALTPDARVVVLKGSGHVTTWDARDENVKAVRDFLAAADSSTAMTRH